MVFDEIAVFLYHKVIGTTNLMVEAMRIRRSGLFVVLLCTLSAGGFVGCDLFGEEPIEELLGDWVLEEQGLEVFVRITRDEITVAVESFSCDTFEIVSYDEEEDEMTIRDNDDEEVVEIRRSGDDLIIEGDRYEETDDFPDCSI